MSETNMSKSTRAIRFGESVYFFETGNLKITAGDNATRPKPQIDRKLVLRVQTIAVKAHLSLA